MTIRVDTLVHQVERLASDTREAVGAARRATPSLRPGGVTTSTPGGARLLEGGPIADGSGRRGRDVARFRDTVDDRRACAS
jgi:hypothetical protein